jgi:hypothetical protein
MEARRKETTVKLSVEAGRQVAQAYRTAVEAALAAVPDEAVTFAALEEAIEIATRQAGAAALATVVAAMGTGYEGASRPCACSGRQTTDHYATCTRQTVLGEVTVRRAAYRCPRCDRHECPLDATLALPATHTSPLLAARLSLFCAVAPFAEACDLLAAAAGVRVSPKRAQLVSEALGARVEAAAVAAPLPAADPARPTPARLYLGVDGVMYCTVECDAAGALLWREAKVAVLYTPLPRGAPGTGRRSQLAPDGLPLDVADPASHHYVVQMGDWQALARKLWRAMQRRGLDRALEIVVLSDGAVWISSLVAEVLAGLGVRVVHILDLRHAEEHLWTVARACLGDGALAWIQTPLDHLHQGRVTQVVEAVRALTAPTEEAAKLVVTTAAYYEDRRAQMDYPAFRAQGMQIGSGLAESACKRLVGQRAKGPGMHWTVAGAQAIATLRAAYLSHRWHEVLDLARAA